MKQGGVSWNTGWHHKAGLPSLYACRLCGRRYKMEWAKDNHEKLCKEYRR